MLLDRPDITCIPICLLDDLSPYAGKTSIIVQKVTKHMDLAVKGQKAFENDQMRLEAFC